MMNNTDRTLNLLLMFGGRSCEHAVSVSSARSLIAAIKGSPYNIHFIGISEQGQWRWANDAIDDIVREGVVNPQAGAPVVPDLNSPGQLINTETGRPLSFRADVIFPLLHGPYGEDGTIQGLFEMFALPYVGCGVAASACGMDKLLSKQIFDKADIPQAGYVELRQESWLAEPASLLEEIAQCLQFPVFVKPANMGSSVGISKVDEAVGLAPAINMAFEYDHKILVENGFENMLEVECAVLGNDEVRASVVGEIRSGAEFYDYAAKYVEDTSTVLIPAPISDTATAMVQALAVKAFKALDGSGLARVDFFVDAKTDQVWLNEINTLPGFTPISMYPKLWEASGLSYKQLVDQLVSLAMQRHESRQSLRCSYSDNA